MVYIRRGECKVKAKARIGVLSKLREMLASGNYDAGSRLPPERELARSFGVSRTVLRSGLATLEAEGKIWRGVGVGTVVGTPKVAGVEQIPDVATLSSPAEIMEVRLDLEPRLAHHAALRGTVRELQNIERLMNRAAASIGGPSYEHWDGKFHRAIAVAAHNKLYLALFDAVNAVRNHDSWTKLREKVRTPELHGTTVSEHLKILEALRTRDAEASVKAMAIHMESVRDMLLTPRGTNR